MLRAYRLLIALILAFQGALAHADFNALGHNQASIVDECLHEQIIGLLENIRNLHDKGVVRKRIDLFADSEEFKAFLSKRGVTDFAQLTERQQDDLRAEFVTPTIKKIQANLETLRDGDLLEQLGVHGDADIVESQGGYEALKALSQKNRNRILSRTEEDEKLWISETSDAMKTAQIKDAEKAIEEIGLSFRHNSRLSAERRKDSPLLLSSRYLYDMGFPPGKASGRGFNADTLKHDNQVFFFVALRRGERLLHNPEPLNYGEYENVVNSDYADQHGWISVFSMQPHEVILALEHAAREKIPGAQTDFNHFVETLKTRYPKDWELARVKAPPDSGLPEDENITNTFIHWHYYQLGTAFQSLVHDKVPYSRYYDFTPTDFQEIIHTQMRRSLGKLLKNSPDKFAAAVTILKAGDGNAVTQLLEELVYKPLDIPSRYEFKIPTAIPLDQIKVQKNGE